MELDLNSKIIIVTGGARGIGESIVRKLADENAIPCIIDINRQLADELANALQQEGKNCFVAIADLTNPGQCKKAIDDIINEFGHIDGVVNNAGLNDGVSLENGTYEKFIQSLKVNAAHYFSITQCALDALKTSKGSVVNICSKVAQTGQGGTSGYAAANGVRFGLTTQWAKELASFDIRVNAIVVAECYTPQYDWWIKQQPNPEASLNAIISKIPFEQRMTLPDEIADTAIFLLSSKSNPINGEFFYVDGGYVHLDRRV
ncbi:L-fucose dehydrogenase [Parafilimonas terrae]|uniref:L-fucose dehydrogenase n=1 Tax=Parafilimonas terrae TaxID=1465490 RepID=A0A1I5THJ2_9BACT|nr:SDR family oxidoreductase [Parafilimonas terrae]SFP82127.1 L-fucose dehydrogenase [Parafilimonas terrae]